MEILEFGNPKNKKIILIHGFEVPYQIWEEYIEYYKDYFHVIVPILPGHNPLVYEEFISFEKSVEELEKYYICRYGKRVYAVYGISMGGVFASYMWQNKNLKIDRLILESAPLVSYNKLFEFLLNKVYLLLTHEVQKRNKKVVDLAKKYIISEDKIDEFIKVVDNISDKTIINYVRAMGKYKLPKNLDVLNTKVIYCYGTKLNELFSRWSVNYIKKNYPLIQLVCFKNKGHCEEFILNPNKRIKDIDKFLIEKSYK